MMKMPFLYHHRWSKSKQLCYFVHLPWKTAVSFPSLYKNTTGCLLFWPRWTSSICLWLPSWCLIFINVVAKRNTLLCEEIAAVIPFFWFSIFTCLTHLSVWSRTSLGTMEDWPPALLPFICWTPSFSIWMVKDGMFHSLAHVRKLLFLSFIVKYKSDYRTKRNVERWERCSLKPIKALLSTRPHSTWSFMQWILIFLQLCL